MSKSYNSIGAVARRYDVRAKTIDRWTKSPKVQFPAPDLVLNTKRKWSDETLDAFDAAQATKQA